MFTIPLYHYDLLLLLFSRLSPYDLLGGAVAHTYDINATRRSLETVARQIVVFRFFIIVRDIDIDGCVSLISEKSLHDSLDEFLLIKFGHTS